MNVQKTNKAYVSINEKSSFDNIQTISNKSNSMASPPNIHTNNLDNNELIQIPAAKPKEKHNE